MMGRISRPRASRRPLLAHRGRRITLPVLMLCACVLSSSVARALTFQFGEEPFIVEQAQQLRLIDEDGAGLAGVAIDATYYPGSEVSREETLCTTDRDGRCSAVMAFAGVVVLSATHDDHEVSERVSVRYDGMPASALLIFLVAAGILFGGLFFGVRHINDERD